MSQDDVILAERLLLLGILMLFGLVLLVGHLEARHPHPSADRTMEAAE